MITNTFFKHRRQWTWTSPGDKVRNTVDYILTRQSSQPNIIDAHVLSNPDISDHRPVRCKMKLSLVKRNKTSSPNKRFDLTKLENSETCQLFQQTIQTSLEQYNPEDDAQKLMNAIEKSVVDASTTVLGKRVTPDSKTWISETTKHAIEQKKQTRKCKGTHSIEYKLAKSNIKKLCKIDKENSIEKEHKDLNNLPLNQKYYAATKKLKLKQTRNVRGWEMKSPSGAVLTNVDDILENWARFYEDLYHTDRTDFTPFAEDANFTIPPVLRSELDNALHKLKDMKAPGPDAITAKMLKSGGEKLHKTLLKLADLIIARHAKSPTQLDLSEIIVLFKKGDLLDCSNYRPICLLSHVYKLIMMILYNRISPELTRALPANQAAYQRGRGTTEQIQILQQTIEKINEFNGQGVICFVDFSKAFDSVDQKKLWETLKSQTNVNSAYINLLARLYDNSKTRIRTDLGTTREIKILRGVKQGDLASAILFCIVLSVILFETFDGLDFGIKLGGESMTDEDYADDIGLMTITIDQMNIILDRLYKSAKKYGLQINMKKTKAMIIGKHPTCNGTITPVMINNIVIDIVKQFAYLGRILTDTSDDMPAVKARIGCGWDAFKKVKSIICSRHISMQSKRKTYETYIMPTVLYAAETMTWKPQMQHHITVFQNHIMRWMCGKRLIDKTPISELTRITGLQPLMNLVRTRKLTWYGHIKRCSLPVKAAVEGLYPGKRNRGRPKRRWRDDIHDWTKLSWNELNKLSKDRHIWKTIVKNCY